MKWVVSIAAFLLLSELFLELVSETKYARFARWVSGVIFLLLFLEPFTEKDAMFARLQSSIQSFWFAMGTERVPEELYRTEEYMENSVLLSYKESVSEQIAKILEQNELSLQKTEMEVQDTGELAWLFVKARYRDGAEKEPKIVIPTIPLVEAGAQNVQNIVSPMELYIRERLAEFYQMDVNKIEVVIEEAD